MAEVHTREDFARLFTDRRYTRGVEVGVQRGYFAKALLDHWPGQLLCVDPWVYQDEYDDIANVPNDEHDRRYAETQRVLAPFGDRACIVRDFSVPVGERQDAESLDFVYLDARHDAPSVAADCRAWWPAIRPGGVLAGHDYIDGIAGMTFGVVHAVNDFAALVGSPVNRTLYDLPPSWWIEKPARPAPQTPVPESS